MEAMEWLFPGLCTFDARCQWIQAFPTKATSGHLPLILAAFRDLVFQVQSPGRDICVSRVWWHTNSHMKSDTVNRIELLH